MNVTAEMGYELLEKITDEMDILFGATTYPWKLLISQHHYDILTEWDRTHRPEWVKYDLFFAKEGHEYIRAVENLNIPFILHYRVVIDDRQMNPQVVLDDLFDPNIETKRKTDWEHYIAM